MMRSSDFESPHMGRPHRFFFFFSCDSSYWEEAIVRFLRNAAAAEVKRKKLGAAGRQAVASIQVRGIQDLSEECI